MQILLSTIMNASCFTLLAIEPAATLATRACILTKRQVSLECAMRARRITTEPV